jgi:hypothetical protein
LKIVIRSAKRSSNLFVIDCKSSSIADCHPASLVIATLLRHPLRGHPASLVIATLLRHPLRGHPASLVIRQ